MSKYIHWFKRYCGKNTGTYTDTIPEIYNRSMLGTCENNVFKINMPVPKKGMSPSSVSVILEPSVLKINQLSD
jgi:hypothetical protein